MTETIGREVNIDSKELSYHNSIIPEDFFTDEVREGFYISGMMKRYWATELSILSEIEKICEKHNIDWYADCGTLLGAVRHGGFIPWDDDLDICMLRDDWFRFFSVAEDELPKGYKILNLNKESQYEQAIGRIINTDSICFEKEHMIRFYGCPYSVGIDIFPLDALSDDEKEEKQRCERIKRINLAIRYAGAIRESDEYEELLRLIEEENDAVLRRGEYLVWDLRILAEKNSALYSTKDASYVALMPYWVETGNHKYPKGLYSCSISLPFEYTTIRVPARYDEVLKIEYGDYMKLYRKWGGHEYPVFSEQESIYREKMGVNPFRYTFPKDMLPIRNPEIFRKNSDDICTALEQAHIQIGKIMETRSWELVMQLLEACQSLAIRLGEGVEYKENSEQCVREWEKYCENIYTFISERTDESWTILDGSLKRAIERMKEFLIERKKLVVFLVTKGCWWDAIEKIWLNEKKDSKNIVRVIPIPFSEYEWGAEHIYRQTDCDQFPVFVELVDHNKVDFERIHPDRIYSQVPFDEWNGTFSIPEKYYMKNLRRVTDELVYIPCFSPDTPEVSGEDMVRTMRYLVEQPAVYYADRIVLESDELRCLYINTLIALNNGQIRDEWEKRIAVIANGQKTSMKRSEKLSDWRKKIVGDTERRIMIYHVTISTLLHYRDDAIRKIRENIEVILKQAERIQCVFIPHPSISFLEQIEPALWADYKSVLRNASSRGIIVCENIDEFETHLIDIDAFYGDAGALAHRCRLLGKPVMIGSGIVLE